MILAGSDENTRPMRRVASRSVGLRILILAASLLLLSAMGTVTQGRLSQAPWSGTRPFGVGEVAG